MPTYLVETFLARGEAGERTARERRARVAAEALKGSDNPVQFEYSIHIPEDEMCFFAFHAASVGDAALVARHAGLEFLRVVEAIGPETPAAASRSRTVQPDANPNLEEGT